MLPLRKDIRSLVLIGPLCDRQIDTSGCCKVVPQNVSGVWGDRWMSRYI
jgi:hypothetical protein